jgi:hypothetical protein
MPASRENQNSSAVGSSLLGTPTAAIGFASRSMLPHPEVHSSTVIDPSTAAMANATASTLNSSRAWVRAVAVGAPRIWRGRTSTPTNGTRKPKNSTVLMVCGSSAVPNPTNRSVPAPAITRAVRAAPRGWYSRSGGNSSSATM